jgi:hypothetical protein
MLTFGLRQASVNEPEANDSRHDQEEGDDIIEQSGYHENENAGD